MPETPARSGPPDGEGARLARVAEAIRRRADADGFVPFDEFQAVALYAPGDGYYEAPGRILGAQGDFYTAAHASPVFGDTVAARIVQEFERLERPGRFRVVELGPGDGTLARTILERIGPALGSAGEWEYVLVERSASLRDLAIDRLRASAWQAHVRAATSLAADGQFVGVVIANEFFDALPARRLRFGHGEWKEMGVRWREDRFVGATGDLRPIVGPPIPPSAADGAILEFSPAADGYVRELSDHLAAGAALVLDYGTLETELLERHPPGTLQAIRGHRMLDDPLERPGSADLSVFVDFSRLRASAGGVGLGETFFGSQAEALGRWGFESALAA
ncbi:MAG: SAM-dependent methyltransferase, partial [Thermoplasmata archaeon]|nr:SAM-dependent methyltransferase [Thermoplasmata archaeon]